MPVRAAVPRSRRSASRPLLAALAVLHLLVLPACEEGGGSAPAVPPGAQTSAAPTDAPSTSPAEAAGPGPHPGKYGCAESRPRLVNGSYEYESEGRGFITLAPGGRYTDPFGVQGTFRYDEASQESRFTGGALDGAVATPLEGEGPRLWVVIPTESGERRWSCSLV